MSDEEERRRREEERKRFERIRSLDTGVQQTTTGRRRHPAGRHQSFIDADIYPTGTQPFNIDPLSSAPPFASGVPETPTAKRRHHGDSFSRATSLPRTRSYGDLPADMYLNQQFGEDMDLGETQPYQQVGQYGQHSLEPFRIQPAPSAAGMSGSSQHPFGDAHRLLPAPSALSRHMVGQQASSQSTWQTGIPHFARQIPIPEPKLVHRYRDPVTGMPSSDRLRQPAVTPRPWGEGSASSQQMGSYLANLSRDNIRQGILAHDRKKSRRQKEALVSRGFQRVEDRYVPQSRPGDWSQRPVFVPQQERDMIATGDFRFNRPQSEIEKPVFRPHASKIAPVGRQQWGPLRRAYSMPDLSDPNLQADITEPSRIGLYMQDYVQLPTADRESYRHFHDQISLEENPNALGRMVAPPTIGNIRNRDRRRLKDIAHHRKELMKYRIGELSAEQLRRGRRGFVRQAAVQQTALPTKTEEEKALAHWLTQGAQESILEEEEEEEEMEE